MGWDGERTAREARDYRAYLERTYGIRPDRRAAMVPPRT